MSKKRSWSLSSKWKLNKEHNDYKQHKQNKRQGGIGYVEEEPKVVRGKKRGKYKCKKLKGEHKFVLQGEHKLNCMDESYNFYKCEACGKEETQQKHRFECADCGAPESWFYFAFGRHSDRKKCKKCGSYVFTKIANEIL